MNAAVILIPKLPGRDPAEGVAALRGLADARGCTVVGVRRVPAQRMRPALRSLLAEGVRPFGALVVPAIAALGRKQGDVVAALAAIHARGIRLIAADAEEAEVAAMLAAAPLLVALRERMTQDALRAGRDRALQRGVRFGRPRLPEERVARVRAALERGAGVREAARAAGVSPASVIRLRASAAA